MADAVFRATQAGAPRIASQLGRVAREIRSMMLAEFRNSQEELVGAFQYLAPYDADERDDYHLSENITVSVATGGRLTATVSVRAVSPETGFNYLDVTRFGRGPIFPKPPRRFLRWEDASGVHFARHVRAYTPGADWVEEARPAADRVVADIADRVGRTVYTRLL